MPAGEYHLFLNNGDCTNNSAHVDQTRIIFSEIAEPSGSIESIVPNPFCQGDTSYLEVSANVPFIRWFKDDNPILLTNNLPRIPIMDAGEYWAVIYNHDPSGFGIEYIGDCSIELEHFTFDPIPVTAPEIIEEQGFLFVTGMYTNYQWYLNGEPIEGANSPMYEVLENGVYHLTVNDNNGCDLRSNNLEVIVSSVSHALDESDIRIWPIPSSGTLNIYSPKTIEGEEVVIYNALGARVHSFYWPLNAEQIELDVHFLENGIYFLEIKSILLDKRLSLKFIKI